jgi:CDP-paratose 2-epimerase
MQHEMHDHHAEKSKRSKPVLITGGSGFIGSNLAERLLERGEDVVLLDNLSRTGVAENAAALAERFGSRVRLVVADVRDKGAVAEWVGQASAVFHFAAQVAVTTSLVDPVLDFDVNVRGTLNVLEALRRLSAPPPLVFTSTNKVYGALSDIRLREGELRYTPCDETLASSGVDEVRPLAFCSPYGCSKGAADQYVIDYAHSFGLKAAVLRMSCIYGPRQFGNEDQGWVAHFLIKALRGEPITLYGDGKQVRDILFVSDLIDSVCWSCCASSKSSPGGRPRSDSTWSVPATSPTTSPTPRASSMRPVGGRTSTPVRVCTCSMIGYCAIAST